MLEKRMLRNVLILACLSVIFASHAVNATVTKGTTSSDNGFAFGGKFCFQALPNAEPIGKIEANLVLPVVTPIGNNTGYNITNLEVIVYDDQEGYWSSLLSNWDDWDCRTKVSHAKFSVSYPPCGQEYLRRREARTIVTSGEQCWTLSADKQSYSITILIDSLHQETRPRYWFVSFANCEFGFSSLDYHLHFTQAEQSEWNHEFGSNEAGLNSLYLLFFFVFSLLLVIHFYGTYKLSQNLQYLHPLVRLFCVILLVEYLGLLASLIHYGVYARDGIGQTSLQKVGIVCDLLSRCLFILLLLLLAKGWTISSERLTHRGPIAAIVASYLALSIGIILWSATATDPKRSVPSAGVEALTILLSVIWLVFGLWFSVQIFYYSYRLEVNPEKKSMYLRIGLIFSPWMLLPPLASFLTFIMDPWARDRVVIAFTLTITVLAYAILSFLFWPSRAEKYFRIATPDVHGVNSDYEQL